MQQNKMPKRAMITIEDSPSPPHVKDEAECEPSTPPPTTPKKARTTPSAASTPVSASKKTPGGETFQSQARTAKGRYMEMIIESGLKALNKKDVLAEVSPDDTLATRCTDI
jgi:hypothetical protein